MGRSSSSAQWPAPGWMASTVCMVGGVNAAATCFTEAAMQQEGVVLCTQCSAAVHGLLCRTLSACIYSRQLLDGHMPPSCTCAEKKPSRLAWRLCSADVGTHDGVQAKDPCAVSDSNLVSHPNLAWLLLCCLSAAVVFGRVVEGMGVVKRIEGMGTQSGKPRARVTIADCGQVRWCIGHADGSSGLQHHTCANCQLILEHLKQSLNPHMLWPQNAPTQRQVGTCSHVI